MEVVGASRLLTVSILLLCKKSKRSTKAGGEFDWGGTSAKK
jgi:hypothetical protein